MILKKILMIICPQFIFGQVFLYNERTEQPISFVEISTSKKIIGYTDLLGKFDIDSYKNDTDTLFYNHSGYESNFTIGISPLDKLYLKEKVVNLDQINLKPLLNEEKIKDANKKSEKYNFSYGLWYVNLLETEHDIFSIRSIMYSFFGKIKDEGLIELTFYEYDNNEPGHELEDYKSIISSSEIKKGNLIFNLRKPLIVRNKKVYIGIRLIDKIGLPLGKIKPSGLSLKYIDKPATNWWIKSSENKKDNVWIKWNKEKGLINMQPDWEINIKY